MQAYDKNSDLPNLLLADEFRTRIAAIQGSWRKGVNTAIDLGIPTPAMSAALSYFDSYRSAELPQNLTQAQRDFFGAHTYERADKPTAGFVHSEWHKLIKK
jgi:6-phosphogluconate dehydrogenase